MKNIVIKEHGEAKVSITDIADFSGNKYNSVRDLLVRNRDNFLELDLRLPKESDFKSLMLNEKQATFLFGIMRNGHLLTYEKLLSFISTGVGAIQKKKIGIYIVTDGTAFKIGIAGDMKKRLSGIQNGNPRQIELIHYQKVSKAVKLEKMLHKYFSEERLMGEWFDLSDKQLSSAIKIIEGSE